MPLIVALTAYINDEVLEKIEEAGFDFALEQPLSKEKISTYIIEELKRRRYLKSIIE